MKKRFKQGLVFLLAVTFLLAPALTTPLATVADEGVTTVADVVSVSEGTPVIVQEDAALRAENSKHFLLSDGSYTAVIYDTPVHYKKRW